MAPHDLGVLETTRHVVENASSVSIVPARVAEYCRHLRATGAQPPAWEPNYHFDDGSPRTLDYLLVLDSVNFCFWADNPWQVEYRGSTLSGYWALAAALTRALEEGTPLLDTAFLAEMDEAHLAHILRGQGQIPLFRERLHILREVGRGLARQPDLSGFVRAVEQAQGSGVALAQAVVEAFPSFRDVASYQGREVRFHKRAQILVADIYGCFQGKRWGAFSDLDLLTCFADYKLPQVLRYLGILKYSPELARKVANKVILEPGSPEEVEIRAATIWAVEYLRECLEDSGAAWHSFELDWLLWQEGQKTGQPGAMGLGQVPPHHRTRTIFY
ncbi:MAG: hypothetical protein HYY01_00865 [Chloroflexi bacterium]|nr:hypothetical protein [Chloroflexota bacterium]